MIAKRVRDKQDRRYALNKMGIRKTSWKCNICDSHWKGECDKPAWMNYEWPDELPKPKCQGFTLMKNSALSFAFGLSAWILLMAFAAGDNLPVRIICGVLVYPFWQLSCKTSPNKK